jgi:hypothetical protein
MTACPSSYAGSRDAELVIAVKDRVTRAPLVV